MCIHLHRQTLNVKIGTYQLKAEALEEKSGDYKVEIGFSQNVYKYVESCYIIGYTYSHLLSLTILYSFCSDYKVLQYYFNQVPLCSSPFKF
jgi:hypothetical protein